MSRVPYSFTRRFFEAEEVVISSCNHCLRAVAESDDFVVLEALEMLHSCQGTLLPAADDTIESEFLTAI